MNLFASAGDSVFSLNLPSTTPASSSSHSTPLPTSTSTALLAPAAAPTLEDKSPLITTNGSPAEAPVSISSTKARARSRRVQLSRAARGAMFELMGLASSSDQLPPFDPLSPNVTNHDGRVLWRWDWSNTVNGSSHNRAFVNAIQETIQHQRESPTNQTWRDLLQGIPPGDWPHLRQAAESAYGNLRREYESRLDETKKLKKDVHKRKNRHRGLKEEKHRRRRLAWQAMQQRGQSEALLVGIDVADAALVDAALDLKYMSSEDSDEGFAQPANSLRANQRKAFVVHPPAWRSKWVGSMLARLDDYKTSNSHHAERGGARPAERTIGQVRSDSRPPAGAPEALIDPEWRLMQRFGEGTSSASAPLSDASRAAGVHEDQGAAAVSVANESQSSHNLTDDVQVQLNGQDDALRESGPGWAL